MSFWFIHVVMNSRIAFLWKLCCICIHMQTSVRSKGGLQVPGEALCGVRSPPLVSVSALCQLRRNSGNCSSPWRLWDKNTSTKAVVFVQHCCGRRSDTMAANVCRDGHGWGHQPWRILWLHSICVLESERWSTFQKGGRDLNTCEGLLSLVEIISWK